MANFLHGVETVELNVGPRPISVVKSAVIGLVGIAPKGPRQTLVRVNNPTEASAFGALLPGFSITRALDSIQKQGAGTVLVVNVFDPATHTTAAQDVLTVSSLKAKTSSAPVTSDEVSPALEVTVSSGSPLVAHTAGVDYNIDDFGNITIIPGGAISEGDVITVDYHVLDASAVTSANIIGSISNGVRTGFKVFELAFNTFGFTPRIFIAPDYSTINAVAAEMIVQANKYRGHALIDAPIGTTPAQAITGRGPLGQINFNTSSKRALLMLPHMKAFDPYTGADALRPYSELFAGVIAATDNTLGYWNSPSNKEIKGITGVEYQISAAINDPQTEANSLNEAGIVTVFNAFGSGLRTWGNRSAAFPSSTAPDNFINVRRTADIIHESIEQASLQFIDQGITDAFIDSVKESVNGFLSTLKQRGAIIDGECTYDPALNPPTQIAAGHVVFSLVFMPPTPAERITFNSFIDINLLASLGQ